METPIFIARVFGLCYLVIGAGFLFNRKTFLKVIDDFCNNATLTFFGGLFALILGIVIILIHNKWVSNWTVMITIIGWAGLIKGIWMIILPSTVFKFMQAYKKNNNLIMVHSSAVLVFGAVLTYFGFFA